MEAGGFEHDALFMHRQAKAAGNTTWAGRAEQGRAGQGSAGQSRAAQGRAEQGSAGQGREEQGISHV